MTYRLGKTHKLMIGTQELCCVGDVTVNESPEVAELRARCASFVKVKPAFKAQTIGGTAYYVPSNPAFAACRAAAVSGTPIEISVIAMSDAGVADETLTGTYYVTSWERSEPVADFVVVNFEFRPAALHADPVYTIPT